MTEQATTTNPTAPADFAQRFVELFYFAPAAEIVAMAAARARNRETLIAKMEQARALLAECVALQAEPLTMADLTSCNRVIDLGQEAEGCAFQVRIRAMRHLGQIIDGNPSLLAKPPRKRARVTP